MGKSYVKQIQLYNNTIYIYCVIVYTHLLIRDLAFVYEVNKR